MNRVLVFLSLIFLYFSTFGQNKKKLNFDESKVRKFVLPNPLISLDGNRIKTPKEWFEKRRPEIVKLISDEMYGHVPNLPISMTSKVSSIHSEENITYKQVVLKLSNGNDSIEVDVLICLPSNIKGPLPVILCMNFMGNHTITKNPQIKLQNFQGGKNGSRGQLADRWPLEMITSKGYAVATLCKQSISLEFKEAFESGVFKLFPKRSDTDWGTMRAWAWGLSRLADYLETDKSIDSKRMAVTGTSRLGGTALLAGAMDQRFKVVMPNVSGKNGCGLLRRNFGQQVDNIITIFPHWFCNNFQKYYENIDALPTDQHMLMSLIAPRPLYVARAQDDLKADNYGAFLSMKNAGPVYKLLGVKGMGVEEMPPVKQPLSGTLGFHIRTGGHGIEDYDWQCFLTFLNRHLKK